MSSFRSARAFLDAVVVRYRTLTSYSDEGRSTRIHRQNEIQCTFRTYFAAPNRYRFAFETPHPYGPLRHRKARCVIGAVSGRPYIYQQSYSGSASIESLDSMELAVAAATGISDGSAHTIASLLLPDVGGFRLRDLRRLRFRRTRIIDGVHCIAVSGLHPSAGRWTAWFGAQDLLLRRLLRPRLQSDEWRTSICTNKSLRDEIFAVPQLEA